MAQFAQPKRKPPFKLPYYLFITSMAFSSTSSLFNFTPSIVGFITISGTMPILCVSLPSG
jgi:hypothetical protein